ncbi:related to flavoprotein [Desulfotalea psychrophila LSv54]|uniref:Related to flavoprotein n=2 Tax=Desulfotalea psychrophila TaxID=84980 RepID=Q6AMQ0_DESPS|nr:related to flavoprotein [Desulfotalea psychrophila LSv54]
MEAIKPEKLFCSEMGKRAIIAHYHRTDWPYQVVKTGTELSLGSRSVQFIETRMLHWPDSMFSYLKEDGILFSNDAFGQHIATEERFDDELEAGKAINAAEHFYATTLTLLSPLVQKLLKTMEKMELDLRLIAPDHGIIWRQQQDEILEGYRRWSQQEQHPEAIIVYDTKWKSTEMMAKAIAQGIEEENVPARLMSLKECHRGDIMQRLLTASTIVLGSATINNAIMPSLASFLMYMKGLKPRKKIGAAFGSYGWGGEAVKQLNTMMDEMKIKRIDDGLRIKYVPHEEQLKECVEYGRHIGRATKADK